MAGLFYGIEPAVTAIALNAAWRIGSRALNNGWMWAIAAASFIAIFTLHAPFPAIVATAALVGALGGRIAPGVFQTNGRHGAAARRHGTALIDDHTPTPPHARYSHAQMARVLIAAVLLWLVPMALLVVWVGWTGTFAQMGWFFTKAAMLTFGGAYAVLPYVVQGAVAHYGWLNATQMIDGLALGETTPGPLIMVVAFVAFVGGWQSADVNALMAEAFGPQGTLVGAVLAAVLVTRFTFLPSFVFILAGGPLVESTHGDLKFTAPLTAITAAVVGVILNLALYFARHVLWPAGLGGHFEWPAALIALAALLALWRFKRGVIAMCALAGLALRLAGAV